MITTDCYHLSRLLDLTFNYRSSVSAVSYVPLSAYQARTGNAAQCRQGRRTRPDGCTIGKEGTPGSVPQKGLISWQTIRTNAAVPASSMPKREARATRTTSAIKAVRAARAAVVRAVDGTAIRRVMRKRDAKAEKPSARIEAIWLRSAKKAG